MTRLAASVGSDGGGTVMAWNSVTQLGSIRIIYDLIDYLFDNDAWQAQPSWVGTMAGSDHRS